MMNIWAVIIRSVGRDIFYGFSIILEGVVGSSICSLLSDVAQKSICLHGLCFFFNFFFSDFFFN